MTLEGGEKVDELGTSEPEERQTPGKFPGLSFTSYVQDLELSKYNLEMPICADK